MTKYRQLPTSDEVHSGTYDRSYNIVTRSFLLHAEEGMRFNAFDSRDFTLVVPAGFLNNRYGYKTGVLTGLGLAAAGGLEFPPASQFLVYVMFLLALFVLAAGLLILETSANPFVIALGADSTGTQRLNLAQAFSPIGVNIGVLMGRC